MVIPVCIPSVIFSCLPIMLTVLKVIVLLLSYITVSDINFARDNRVLDVLLLPFIFFLHLFCHATFEGSCRQCSTGQIPFVSPIQQCKITEENSPYAQFTLPTWQDSRLVRSPESSFRWFKEVTWLQTHPFWGQYHAISCMHSHSTVSISRRHFEMPSFTNFKDMMGEKLLNVSCNHDHAQLGHSLSWQD